LDACSSTDDSNAGSVDRDKKAALWNIAELDGIDKGFVQPEQLDTSQMKPNWLATTTSLRVSSQSLAARHFARFRTDETVRKEDAMVPDVNSRA
jgi:hypothetical protein